MKNNNIKIAVIEEGDFYNNLIENQVFDICREKQYKNIHWVIKSFGDTGAFKKDTKTLYQAILFDNYYKQGNKNAGCSVRAIIDEVKLKNDNCLFISISGYREMLITAEFYKEGELQFFFSKQSNGSSQSLEEECSIPTIYKLMDKLISSLLPKTVHNKPVRNIQQKQVTPDLRISA